MVNFCDQVEQRVLLSVYGYESLYVYYYYTKKAQNG
jgi:hypothetical protein